MTSLIDRVVLRKWKLAECGDPRRVLLYLGWKLAAIFRAIRLAEPIKEERLVLGKKMMVNVYDNKFWSLTGDNAVERLMRQLKARPELLEKLPGDKT